MLEAIPVQNAAAKADEVSQREVDVTVPNKKLSYLFPPLSWTIRPKKELRFRLDPVGTFIWRLCNGKRNVESIVDAFSREFRLTFHEARIAVTTYLKTLVQRGVVAMAMTDTAGDEG